MRRDSIFSFVLVLVLTTTSAFAQEQVEAPSGQKTLGATMNVYVFPTKGQAPEQQSKDEAECYSWAVTNTGTDPFELSKKSQAAKDKAAKDKQQAAAVGKGAGASGAVRGAAVGALIGEIASDDAGKGAAYGAAAGVVAGRRRGRAARSQAEAQAEATAAQTQKATEADFENFKKAFSVCLEAKGYMVKY